MLTCGKESSRVWDVHIRTAKTLTFPVYLNSSSGIKITHAEGNMKEGTEVKVLDESGNVCANGKYYGQGIPTKDLNAVHKHLPHYAILVEDALRYYPTGYFTLMKV